MDGRIRTAAAIRNGVSYIKGSAATLCECGGLLAENRAGVWCLECETEPTRVRGAA